MTNRERAAFELSTIIQPDDALTLVCWCKTEHEPPPPDEPYCCHGDVIREFVERETKGKAK